MVLGKESYQVQAKDPQPLQGSRLDFGNSGDEDLPKPTGKIVE